MAKAKYLSNSHVLWAYDHILWDYKDEGLTPAQMRERLRDEWSLHVGVDAIKSVLATGRPAPSR